MFLQLPPWSFLFKQTRDILVNLCILHSILTSSVHPPCLASESSIGYYTTKDNICVLQNKVRYYAKYFLNIIHNLTYKYVWYSDYTMATGERHIIVFLFLSLFLLYFKTVETMDAIFLFELFRTSSFSLRIVKSCIRVCTGVKCFSILERGN